MRKPWWIASLTLALGLGWLAVLAASAPDRPSGVAEGNWYPIGDKLGIAIDSQGARVSGRLMAKVQGRWIRIEIESEDRLRYLPAR